MSRLYFMECFIEKHIQGCFNGNNLQGVDIKKYAFIKSYARQILHDTVIFCVIRYNAKMLWYYNVSFFRLSPDNKHVELAWSHR